MTIRLGPLSVLLMVQGALLSAQKAAPAPALPCLDFGFSMEPLDPVGGAIATLDLDLNGSVDVAILNDTQLRIWLRDPTGRLVLRQSIAAQGYFSTALASGDMNGDGFVDLVAADASNTSILVALNTGTGMFLSPQYYLASPLVGKPWVVDLDADGDLDVVARPRFDGSSTGILVNSGNGSLTLVHSLPTGEHAAVGDVDGDGAPDLVGASTATGLVSTWINDGLGSLSLLSSLVLTEPGPVAIADLDGDGDGDLATKTPSGVDVLVNQGGASFAPPTPYPALAQQLNLVAADIDADGRIDLACTDQDSFTVLRNLGGASFVTTGSWAMGFGGGEPCFADQDGDGDLDAAFVSAVLLENRGAAGFENPVLTAHDPGGQAPLKTVAVCDLNGDRLKDLVLTANQDLWVFTQVQRGVFTSASLGLPALSSIAMADMDGDRDEDLVAVGAPGLILLRNLGSGTFGQPEPIYGLGIASFVLTDLENDGDIDIAAADPGSASISRFLNWGDGTFAAPARTLVGGSIEIAAGNLNGDGRPDLVINGTNGVAVLFSAGATAYRPLQTFIVPPELNPDIHFVTIGDINQDGLGDIAMADLNFRVLAMYNRGNERFAPVQGYEIPFQPNDILIADLNEDGFKDILVSGHKDIFVLENQGLRTFQGVRHATASFPRSLACADLDGNGHLDLVTPGYVPEQRGGAVSVLFSECR